MKIIKEGTIPSTTKRFTCPKCGCIFECESGEYRNHTNWCNTAYYVSICPTCKNEVITWEPDRRNVE